MGKFIESFMFMMRSEMTLYIYLFLLIVGIVISIVGMAIYSQKKKRQAQSVGKKIFSAAIGWTIYRYKSVDTVRNLFLGGENMINKIIEDVNKSKKGMPIPDIPKATKTGMKIGSLANKIVGVSLVAFGLTTSKKWAIPLGITSMIANSLIQKTFDGDK